MIMYYSIVGINKLYYHAFPAKDVTRKDGSVMNKIQRGHVIFHHA